MAKKVYEEENIRAIAGKIREKTGSETTYKTSDMPGGVETVYEAGQKSHNKMLWDSMAKENQWFHTFAGQYWNDTTFNPTVDLIVPYTSNLFYRCYITDLKGILERNGVKLDFSKATRLNGLFEQSTITRSPVIDTRKCVALQTFLYGAGNLVSVDKIILKEDGSQTISNLGFRSCESLKDVVFEGKWGCDLDFSYCVELTHNSLKSIINALKDFYCKSIECDIETGPFDNLVTDYNEKYEIIDLGNTYITVSTENYGYMAVPLNQTIPSDELAGATYVVFKNASLLELYYPVTETVKTLTLGSTNLAKLTDAEKKKATDKGWALE